MLASLDPSLSRPTSRDEPVVLMYHEIISGDEARAPEDPAAAAYAVSAETFRAHLEVFESAGRRMAEPASLVWPLAPGEILLTFDDGAASDYDIVFPLLKEKQKRAIFFITTGEIGAENRVSRSWLREMAEAGMAFGSHGHSHRLFSELSPEEQRREMETSRQILEDAAGSPVRMLSLPGGRFNRHTFPIAADLGFEAVFISSPTPPARRGGVWVIGRIPIRAGWTPARMEDFLLRQKVRLRQLRQADALRRLAQAVAGPRAYARLHRLFWKTVRNAPKKI